MTEINQFRPTTSDQFIERLNQEIDAGLTAQWQRHSGHLKRNLKVLADTSIRMGALLATNQITPAEADAILYQQEQLFNATLNHIRALPFIAAQSILNSIFKVAGWVVFNYSGVNLFPALVKP